MKVPTVGESVTEVTIASWSKKDGDLVKMDEILCELESDKATFELPAEGEGILRILAKEGETLAIGASIARIESVSTGTAALAPTSTEEVKPLVAASQGVVADTGVSESIQVIIPAVGESVTEVIISAWSKKNGDVVAMDEYLCELESDKATFELPAEAAGTLQILVTAGTTVAIGTAIATITKGATGTLNAVKSPEIKAEVVATNTQHEVHTTPVAAKILAEKGISPTAVQGSGTGGRIMKEDALKAGQAIPVPSVAPVAKPVAVAPAPQTESRGSRREKMTSLRKTVARRLVAVKNETAMLTTFNEVDMKPVMDLRTKFKDKFKEKHGVNLGFMSFFTKAVCVALKDFPSVNAKIDGEEIVYHDFCDISIAVSAPKGLVVPVVRNAEKMNFAQIESEISRLALKARDGKLSLEDMSGGTFTITNGGVFGSLMSTPIINAPQVAILGMHAIKERPVVVDGQIVIRPMMYLALSYDHRIIDGKESVSFLVKVKEILEDPTKLLFDL